MAISLSAITGAAITGLTSPTYTPTADVPPNAWSKQWSITAIGGTQTGVDTGASASRPWSITVSRPQNVRQLNAVDSNNVLRSVPMNTYVWIGRKGMTPLAGQPSKTNIHRYESSVPAGADVADIPNLKAANSCFLGALWQQAQGWVDLQTTGVF
jgi:hypothetical protein